jgi:hypothetical protein
MSQVSAVVDRGFPRLAERYLLLFVLAVPLVYAILLALDWNRVGSRDLDQFLVFHQLQYWNYQLFGFAKQWTPVLCSGVSLAAEPQVPLLSLSMMLGYVLGPLRGMELAVLIYLVWGWIGAYLYAGLCTTVRGERLLAASLFIGNGFFVCRIGYGHIDFIPFLTLPFMLWLLHRLCAPRTEPGWHRYRINALAVLSLAAALSLAVDGSPVSIIHLLFWIVCYAFVLAATTRSALPVLVVLLAGVIAAALDAGYLWPMISAQFDFPRLTGDTFTNPLALLWFALLPVRGRLILPATGGGHELSVFIGPVIALAIWRYREALLQELPANVRYPLIVVSLISIWMGMGSLHAIDIPVPLSPFDWFRALPGFRSMGVTARYWGFLALPLSLLGAAALRRFALALPNVTSLRAWMITALLLQVGFQTDVLVAQALPGRSYSPPDARSWFATDGRGIRFVYCRHQRQGALIAPRQGVIDCYDNDDFTRADMRPGSDLVQTARLQATGKPVSLTANFMTWKLIRIMPAAPPSAQRPDDHSRVVVVLNQAYNRYWHSPDCELAPDARGNMVASCNAIVHRALDLEFYDPVSALGARVSVAAWPGWVCAMIALLTFGT